VRKVIYVSFIHLTDKVLRDWYITFLIGEGAPVEYWDITDLVLEKIDEPNLLAYDYSHHIQSLLELEAKLRLPENKEAIYYNCKTVHLDWGAMPTSMVLARRKLWQLFQTPSLLLKKVLSRTELHLAKDLGLVKPLDIVFAAGRVLLEENKFANRVIPINLVDYDRFVQVQSATKLIESGRYAVFLDTNLPFQSDLNICNLPILDSHRYYSSLNNFFSMLEIKFNIKVIIAEHPNSNYGPEVFDGREKFRGVTPELVKDADFVITQTSVALSYAVLNSKPLIFIYTNEMLALYENTLMKYLINFSSYLDSPLINIDKIENDLNFRILEPNRERYITYKYDYLTSPESEHLTTQEIFFNELSAM